jgi:hypothetical protein
MNIKMKSGLLALATVALLGSQAALAQVNVTAGDRIKFADGPGASPGGAFILTAYDSTGTTVKGSFESFCVEKNEYMSYGTFYKIQGVSTSAKNGGVSGQTSPNNDPLGFNTAWLYTQYIENPSALGAVAGWNAADAVQRGTAMQQAVWFMEGEISSGLNPLAFSLVTASNNAGWNNVGRVKILNVTTMAGGLAQDQLYITPVPEPEIYAMMGLGLGLMGFMARRRKQAAV